MKKARIVLTAVAAVGLLGGVFAFKAKRTTDTIYLAPGAGLQATITLSGATITNTSNPNPTYATTKLSAVVNDLTFTRVGA